MTQQEAREFAIRWIAAWNDHDLDGILEFYDEGIALTSPLIPSFVGEASGTLRGKEQVENFWAQALTMIPDLRFELIDVFTGQGSIVLCYKAPYNRRAAEVMELGGNGKISRSVAHYAES